MTVIPITITKNKFKMTLTIPEIIRHIKGVFVSPCDWKIAASKLYRNITGMPQRYTRRYNTAISKQSLGTDIISSVILAIHCPSTKIKKPEITATRIAVCAAFSAFSLSFLPV